MCDGDEEEELYMHRVSLLSLARPMGNRCKLCNEDYGGSHYHCGRCGRVGSYQGCYGSHDGGNTWGFSCKPEDVEAWTLRMGGNMRLNEATVELTVYPNIRDIVDEISGMDDRIIFDVIERLLDGQEGELIEKVHAHTQETLDRWKERDNA